MSEPRVPGPFPDPAPAAASRGRDLSLGPRSAVLLVASFATVLIVAVLSQLPVPYVVLKPGPALNTLGRVGGTDLIVIEGRRSYPTSGALDLTTVSLFGGPGTRLSFLQALRGWVDGTQAVVPVASVFPPDQTREESEQLNQAEMTSSQENATAAALAELDIPVPTTLTVDGFSDGAPSARVLRAQDVVLAVNGVPTPDLAALKDEVGKVAGGAPARLQVRRGGRTRTLSVPTTTADGRTVLGVLVDPGFRFPFTVRIQIEDVGGPSAGTMFALGIIDKLTPGEMTGGRRIAGTGTMDVDGRVGPIGGIQQKLVGARAAGAEFFLAPADECAEVVGHVPDGLTVVPVATLAQARDAVEAIGRAGAAAPGLPSC